MAARITGPEDEERSRRAHGPGWPPSRGHPQPAPVRPQHLDAAPCTASGGHDTVHTSNTHLSSLHVSLVERHPVLWLLSASRCRRAGTQGAAVMQ
eukprot:3145104-Prymnesium_polylepis.1